MQGLIRLLVGSKAEKPVECDGDAQTVFLPVNTKTALDGWQDECFQYLKRNIEKFDEVIAGKKLAWLEPLFMVPPGFPSITAREIAAKDSALRFDATRSVDGGGRIDLWVDENASAVFSIWLGNHLLKAQQNGKKVRLTWKGESKALDCREGYFAISWLYLAGQGWLVWASGRRYRILAQNTSVLFGPEVSLDVEAGRLGVLWIQAWNSSGQNFYDPAQDGGLRREFRTAPFWVREWEERARRGWHLAVAMRVCCDYLLIEPELEESKRLKADLVLIADLFVNAIAGFPRWRPSAGESKDVGPWERGNWSNGFLLGTYGVAIGILYDLEKRHFAKSDIEVADKQGADWLIPNNDRASELDFPSFRHWLRRSTNHGVVILASALVGISEVQRVGGTQELRAKQVTLENEFWELLRGAFKEGAYTEGVRYAQFSLQEALPLILYKYLRSGKEWFEFEAQHIGFLEKVKDFCWFSAYPGAATPYVAWGDCPVLSWKSSVLHFLDSIPSDSVGSLVELVSETPRSSLFGEVSMGKEIVPTEPLLLASQLLPKAPREGRVPRLVHFGDTGVAMGAVGRPTTWRTRFLSSRVHLTHNKDHDVGSFIVATKGTVSLGEVAGRGLWRHSTINVKNFALEHSSDPYSGYGAMKEGKLLDRSYRANMRSHIYNKHLDVVSIEADKGLVFDGERPLISWFRRDLITVGEEAPMLLIVTRGRSREGVEPFVNFVSPVNGFETYRDTTRYKIGHDVFFAIHTEGKDSKVSVTSYPDRKWGQRLIQEFPSDEEVFFSVATLSSKDTSPIVDCSDNCGRFSLRMNTAEHSCEISFDPWGGEPAVDAFV